MAFCWACTKLMGACEFFRVHYRDIATSKGILERPLQSALFIIMGIAES